MLDRAVLALQVGGDGIFRIGAGERETVAGQSVLRERLPRAAAQRLDRYGVRPGQRQGKQDDLLQHGDAGQIACQGILCIENALPPQISDGTHE